MNHHLLTGIGSVALASLLLATKPNFNFKPNLLQPDYSHDRWVTLPRDSMHFFTAYTVSFDGEDDNNGDFKGDRWAIPEWVSYEIKAKQGDIGKAPKRPKVWLTDPVLFPAGIAPSDDSYHYSKKLRDADPDNPMYHYDRGHMCRKSTAFRLGPDADYNTHTVMNACPQRDDLNQGIWKDLEDRVERWADEFDSIWVVCGPVIYDHKPKAWLGEEGEVPVAIPDAFFKIIIRHQEKDSPPEVLALIYPQDAPREKPYSDASHLRYTVPVDSVEGITGLDFLTALPAEKQNSLESKKATSLWK